MCLQLKSDAKSSFEDYSAIPTVKNVSSIFIFYLWNYILYRDKTCLSKCKENKFFLIFVLKHWELKYIKWLKIKNNNNKKQQRVLSQFCDWLQWLRIFGYRNRSMAISSWSFPCKACETNCTLQYIWIGPSISKHIISIGRRDLKPVTCILT